MFCGCLDIGHFLGGLWRLDGRDNAATSWRNTRRTDTRGGNDSRCYGGGDTGS